MKRESYLAAWLLMALVPASLAQDLQSQPSPVPPSDILGPRLIAWSQLQKPQPVSEPVASEPIAAEPARQSEQSAQSQQQPPAMQTLIGTVVKDGGRYILKVSKSTAYQLDDQQDAKRYEGKQVRVTGALDAQGNSFHVTRIELVS